MRKWDVWKKLQAGAAVLVLVIVVARPEFWDDPAAPDNVMAVFFGPILAAACVFAVSHIVELIGADVGGWRARRRDKRAKPGLVEVLPPDSAARLADERRGNRDQVVEGPAHRQALQEWARRRIGDDPREGG